MLTSWMNRLQVAILPSERRTMYHPMPPPSDALSAAAVDARCVDPHTVDNLSKPEDLTSLQEEIPADPISYWDQAAERLSKKNPKVYEAFQEIRKDIPREKGVLATSMMD